MGDSDWLTFTFNYTVNFNYIFYIQPAQGGERVVLLK